MKTYIVRFLAIAALLLNSLLYAQTNPNHVYVNSYYRSNGTYVEGYYRTAPNSTNRDNFSTVGNTNPYTGKPGWIPADNNSYSGTSTYTYSTTTPNVTSYDVSKYYNNNSNTHTTKQNHYSGVSPTSSVTYYTTTELRLRGGPSTEDEIVLTMPSGATVKVVNDIESWSYVYYNGYYGYASSKYLSATSYLDRARTQFENSTEQNINVPSYGGNYNNYNQNYNTGYATSYSTSSSSKGGKKVLAWIVGLAVTWLFFRWLKS